MKDSILRGRKLIPIDCSARKNSNTIRVLKNSVRILKVLQYTDTDIIKISNIPIEDIDILIDTINKDYTLIELSKIYNVSSYHTRVRISKASRRCCLKTLRTLCKYGIDVPLYQGPYYPYTYNNAFTLIDDEVVNNICRDFKETYNYLKDITEDIDIYKMIRCCKTLL